MAKRQKTAVVAQSILSGHDALYVRRAREAVPPLVQLARGRRVITYGNLARLMGMPNARNLNFVLGCVGATLTELSEQMGERVPPLQSIVVNSATGSPGRGFDQFLREWYLIPKVTRELRPVLLQGLQGKVFDFDGWLRVLKGLGLTAGSGIPEMSPDRAKVKRVSGRGGGESPEHKAFKRYIAANPSLFGLSARLTRGETEHVLPSGDVVDVLFVARRRRLAVEVKSHRSAEDDMLRGVFQCIKYDAVMRAESIWHSDVRSSSCVLALEGNATDSVRRVAALLGVELRESVRRRS